MAEATNNTFRKTLFFHGYLLIIAAWLFTISFVVNNYWAFTSTPHNVQKGFEEYLSERENKFEKLLASPGKLSTLLQSNSDKSSLKITDADFGLFAFNVPDSGKLQQIYWSTFNMSLNDSDVNRPDGFYPFHGTNGLFELLKQRVHYQNSNYIVAALIPVKWKYFIENKYFTNSFANSSVLDNLFYIDSSGNGYPVYNSRQQEVFKISEIKGSSGQYPNNLSAILKAAAIIFILIFINSAINDITVENGFYVGVFWLLSTIALLRIITYMLPVPLNFQNYELFSPLIYASSTLNSSLGDLLINVLLFFWITFFVKYRHNQLAPNGTPPIFLKRKKLWGIVSLFLFAFFTTDAINIIYSLVLDSKIPLNVTDFFHLNAYTFVAFLIITFITLSYFNLSYILFLPALRAGFDLLWRIVIIVSSALLIISIRRSPDTIFIQLMSILWMVIYCILLNYRKNDLSQPLVNSSYFLFWLMFYAASVTLVLKSIHGKETEQKIRMANDIAMQAGNEEENLLKMAITNFTGFFYDKSFERFYSANDNYFVKDSLTMSNFQGFLNKYDSHIYTFDSLQHPLYNSDSTSFNILNAMIGTMSKPANIPDLYVYETSDGGFNYIYRKKINGNDTSRNPLGYLFMVINPKRFTGGAFPELLQGSSLLNDEAPQSYSYAVYNNRRLVGTGNDYDFSDSISAAQIPAGEYKEDVSNLKKEFWYNAGNNITVVITENNNTFIDSITLFAYIFLSSAILIVLFKIAGFIIQSRFRWRIIKQAFKFTIRFQIHTTIIFISIFSFVIIGISTISFFILRFNKDNDESLTQNMQVIGNEIQASLNTRLPLALQTPEELDNYYSSDSVEKKIIQIAALNNSEINYYGKNGTLQASSQPYIYNKNIVSNKMQPAAYYQMRYKHRISFMQEEKIGNFQYLSGYIPLYDAGKNILGFLNVPLLHSQSELQQEISRFLVTVINLNALIFLLAGAIAGLLTLRITKSFDSIKGEMRRINLGIENKELEWKRNDELGDLVKEYNIMVNKLNESVKALAQSEREGAWKEMARQVAHEIKNPLTPMKLNLQFLQRSAENKNGDIQDLSKKIPALLIEQIDQLAKIANDFSQFADIHNTNPEPLVLSEKLNNIVMLYNADDKVKITFEPSPEKSIIYADKKQLNRVFTNLIKNAIEASDDNNSIEIFIKEEKSENNVSVSIKDNGHGVPQELADKLFAPNFTTKSSGTGLGLAICKGIIERAGGQIRFESEKNKGTTFYVSLPLFKA